MYLFKVNKRNFRKRCEICLKLTIKTPERHWHDSDVFIVKFKPIWHLFSCFNCWLWKGKCLTRATALTRSTNIWVVKNDCRHICFYLIKGSKQTLFFICVTALIMFTGASMIVPVIENCINPFQLSVAFHIEISHSFCSAKQLTGFYMKRNTGLKWVNRIRKIYGRHRWRSRFL